MSQDKDEKKKAGTQDKDDTKRIDELSLIRSRELRERVRGRLAQVFILLFGFLIVSSLVMWIASLLWPLRGTVAEIKDMVITVSALFSGPLGLLLGFYFRGEVEGRVV